MNEEINRELDRIQEEAAAWVARLDSGDVTHQQRRQFSRWIKQSPMHREEFFKMRAVMAGVNQVIDTHRQPSPGLKRTAVWRGSALAACLLLLVAGLLIRDDVYCYWLADYHTGTGRQQAVVLDDGSTLYLNTGSAVAVDFDSNRRRIELLKGEAEFVVAHDSARPFSVAVGNDTVTALGTDFSVRRLAEGLIVTVFENAVQVERNAEPVAVIEQGRQMQLPIQLRQVQIQAAELGEARAWRDGKLIFTARPLREVIAEINRYRRGEILLLADAVAGHPVSGVFAINQLNDSLAVIAETLSLKRIQIEGVVTVLY